MRTPPLLALLLAVLPVALVYGIGLHHEFVWLDHFEIVDGALIVDSPRAFFELFGNDRNYAGYHRPIYNLLHSVDRAWSGLDPFGYQLSSRLLHLANVALVFALLRRLFAAHAGGTLAAGFAALLFGLHPVNTATAGLIHAKADLFVLSALATSAWCLVRGLRTAGPAQEPPPAAPPQRLHLVGSWLAFLLACFTKESAFLFPFGATLWVLFCVPAPRRRALRSWLAGLWILVLAALALRLRATDTSYPSALSLPERLATFVPVYVDYVRKLILPLDLTIADTVRRFSALSDAARLQALFGFAFLVVAQLVAWWRAPFTRKWIALHHLALLPVAQLVPILHFRADRFLYVSSLAFAGLVVEAALRRSAASPPTRRWLPVAGLALASLYAWRDVARLPVYADDATLFGTELAREPDYLEGLTHLARRLDGEGRFAEARPLYAYCFRPHPDLVSFFDGEATLLAYSANLLANDAAQDAYALLEEHGPKVTNPHVREELAYNRAVAARRLGRNEEAFEAFAAYTAGHPDDASAHFLLGQTALSLGRRAEARAAFERYLSLVPEAPERSSIEAALTED